MCGISGIVMLDRSPADAERVRAMTNAMTHRGPDAAGFLNDGSVAFGMRRLAIIDLPCGDQPIFNEDKSLGIVYNGELYNFRELRCELETLGHQFRTHSDTEVIVHAYESWGDECPRRFDGIFAFAILDRRNPNEPVVFSARDQLGVKPFYYWTDGRAFVLASEVRALLASGLVPRRLDLKALRSYLAYGSVQDPYTLVDGVRSLEAGYSLTIARGKTSQKRYWSLPDEDAVRPWRDDRIEDIRKTLFAAVERQLMSDVPLGVFLSGGIDSTAIAALAQRATGNARTFSIVFDEAQFDERKYARLAAERIGTQHHELQLTSAVVRDTIEKALASFDQPSADGLNTYYVSNAAHEAGLTVALSGVGGDELFGGYDGYARTLFTERWGNFAQRIPTPFRQLAGSALAKWGGPRYRRAADAFDDTAVPPVYFARRYLGEREIAALLQVNAERDSRDWYPDRLTTLASENTGRDPVNRASAVELQTYMVSTLLRDTDQMGMANSLEIRVPLIDVTLVNQAFTIAGAHKLDARQPKPLLTKALQDMIPSECVFRPKQGFVLPIASWLRGTLEERVRDNLTGEAPQPYPFSREGLQKLWLDFQSGRVGWGRVWAVFVLRNWMAEHGITA